MSNNKNKTGPGAGMIIAGGIALAAVGIFKGIQYLTSETKEGKEESTPEEGQKEEIKQEEKAEIPDQNLPHKAVLRWNGPALGFGLASVIKHHPLQPEAARPPDLSPKFLP